MSNTKFEGRETPVGWTVTFLPLMASVPPLYPARAAASTVPLRIVVSARRETAPASPAWSVFTVKFPSLSTSAADRTENPFRIGERMSVPMTVLSPPTMGNPSPVAERVPGITSVPRSVMTMAPGRKAYSAGSSEYVPAGIPYPPER